MRILLFEVETSVQLGEMFFFSISDPRPKLTISNNTVYIGENYIANNLLAWIKVEARNVQTNRFAKVRFSIIKGKFKFIVSSVWGHPNIRFESLRFPFFHLTFKYRIP